MTRFRAYLAAPRGAIAAAAVLAYALVLALFIGLTWVEPLTPDYQLDFGNSAWIQMPQPEIAAYFRKSLYIPNPVAQAWLMVAGTGNYNIYVNGVHLDDVMYPSARPSGIYDIKALILPGKNVIGIHVAGGLSPDPPQIRVRGAYRMVDSPAIEFVSDRSWKTAETPDGVIGGYAWTATNLDDTLWQNAAPVAVTARFSTVQPIDVYPPTLELPPAGDWIASPAHGKRAAFTRQITMAATPSQAWVQVAATGGYDLLINGRPVAALPNNNLATLFGPQASINLTGQTVLPSVQMPSIVTPSSGVAGANTLGFIQSVAPVPVGEAISTGPSTDFSGPPPRANPSPAATPTPSAQNQFAPNPGQHYQIGPTPTPTPAAQATVSGANTAVGGNFEQPVLPTITTMAQPIGIGGAQTGNLSAFTMPGLATITPALTGAAGQPIPLSTTLGAGLNVPVMTAFDVTRFMHSGVNQITVTVSSNGGASMLFDGIFEAPDGRRSRLLSDHQWSALTLDHLDGALRTAQPALVLGVLGGSPWGPLPQVAAITQSFMGADTRVALHWFITILLTLLGVYALWWAAGNLLETPTAPAESLWSCDAVIQFAMLLGLLLVLLTTFDARCAYDWCFKPSIVLPILLALLASKLLLALVRKRPEAAPAGTSDPRRYRLWGYDWQLFALALLVIIGGVIRAWNLTTLSMSHDEVSMATMSRGVLQLGFPFMRTGSFIRYPATYEIVPYPLAFFSLILGPTTLAYRLPALLFGTATIALIGWVGYRMMSWRVGLLSALIVTFLPSSILWSRDAFYCAQECFLQLLTIWLFYEGIRERGINPRYIVLAAVSFLLTYFSWEGSGFLIVALFVAILFYKWGEWDWIWNRRLWTCTIAIAVIIALQFSYRQLVLLPEYLSAGKDLNDLSSPQLALLDRLVFNPYYYLQQFFLTDNNAILFAIALVGLLFAWRKRAIFYLYLVLITLVVMYTCFLGYYAPRYSFHWTSPLVLIAAGTAFYIVDRLTELARDSSAATWLERLGAALLLVFIALSANPYVMKLYRLSWNPNQPPENSRLGSHYLPDYRSVDLFVARHLLPGDGVACPSPHVFLYDTGRTPDYSLDTMLVVRRTYDGGQEVPHYIDRFLGVKLITTLGELDRARMSHKRLWVISRNASVELPAVTAYIRAHGRVAFESDEQSVIELDGISPEESLAAK